MGPLFSSVGGSCWCCCDLPFVLDCLDLRPLPGVATCERANSHYLYNVRCLGYVKDLAVHVLTHVFITARSLTCCARTSPAKRRTTRLAIGHASLNLRTLSRVLRVVWDSEEDSSPSRHCAWKQVIPELGWPPCRRHGRGFRRATCGPLLRVAGNASSGLCLEGLYRKRRSAPLVRLCSARIPAIVVHSSALDRRVSASASRLQSRRSCV